MVSAVAVDAARDTDRVGLFLDALGIRATPEQPKPMPAGFLLHLGAALRLHDWEAQGFFFHRTAGLPPAREVIQDAFRSLDGPDAGPPEVCVTVLRLSLELFAWDRLHDLDADVALDYLTEDVALDVLAEYLWASRHAGPGTQSPQP
jgi:hypothetical protein